MEGDGEVRNLPSVVQVHDASPPNGTWMQDPPERLGCDASGVPPPDMKGVTWGKNCWNPPKVQSSTVF